MLDEFKKFIARGNVLDMAVGIIIGAAFTTVVKSMVDDLLMPPLGMLTGGIDFSDLYIDLSRQGFPSLAAAQEAGAPTINYGLFINAVVNFLIVAFAVFMLVRAVNRMMIKEPAVATAPTEVPCPQCKMSIPIGAQRCGHCTQAI
jgi:large conductance mechanosensitive channel